MKKLLAFILCLLVALAALASPVPESKCRALAADFLKSRKVPCSVAKLELLQGRQTKSSMDAPAYFVYRNPSRGFVIVAGDDAVPAIIGYSDKGEFRTDNQPENFRAWMQMWEKIISERRASGAVADEEIAASWKLRTADSEDSFQLETAQWDQPDPYNLYCPNRYVTGCTATATAIVMRYHKWPDAGVGTLPAYTTATESISVGAVELGEKYDWDNMPLKLGYSTTDAQKSAVAKLIFHVGVMLKSDYTAEYGTSAYTVDIPPGLSTYMKYDRSITTMFSKYYKPAQWVSMLKNQLRAVGPIVYGGQSGNGGHAFVIDGYEGNNLHINWGWGGSNNGCYQYPNFAEYRMDHTACFNMKKDEGGEPESGLTLYSYSSAMPPYGIKTSVSSIKQNEEFTGSLCYLVNLTEADFNGYVGLGNVDAEGNVKEVAGTSSDYIKLRAGYIFTKEVGNIACKLTKSFDFGDRLMAIYRTDMSSTWHSMPYDTQESSMVGEIPLTDVYPLDEATSLTYNVKTKQAVLVTKDGVTVKLLDSSRGEVQGAVIPQEDGITFIIDASKLQKGSYTLSLSKKEENKEVVLVF